MIPGITTIWRPLRTAAFRNITVSGSTCTKPFFVTSSRQINSTRELSQKPQFHLYHTTAPNFESKTVTTDKMAAKQSDHLEYNDHNTSGLPEHEKRKVHENRMDRPPYALAEGQKREDFKAIYTGSCFCEKVKFEISREKPLDAKFCHCPTCQRLHGAPFQWAAIFHKTDVLFTEGSDQLIYWNPGEKSQEYILPCKISCKNCRTPIMDEGRNMLLLYPTLVHFKDLKHKRLFYPSCHIFYSRRAVDMLDGLPKFSKHKDESELIPEKLEEES